MKRIIKVKSRREDDLYFTESEEYNLYAYGESKEESERNFISHLEYFTNYYNNIPEEQLIGKAKDLKKKFNFPKGCWIILEEEES